MSDLKQVPHLSAG